MCRAARRMWTARGPTSMCARAALPSCGQPAGAPCRRLPQACGAASLHAHPLVPAPAAVDQHHCHAGRHGFGGGLLRRCLPGAANRRRPRYHNHRHGWARAAPASECWAAQGWAPRAPPRRPRCARPACRPADAPRASPAPPDFEFIQLDGELMLMDDTDDLDIWEYDPGGLLGGLPHLPAELRLPYACLFPACVLTALRFPLHFPRPRSRRHDRGGPQLAGAGHGLG